MEKYVLRAAHHGRQDHRGSRKREVKDGEIKPACVQSCPSKALGSAIWPIPRVKSPAWQSRRAAQVVEDLGTAPKVTYLQGWSTHERPEDRLSATLLRPLNRSAHSGHVLVAFLGTIVASGLFAWLFQMWQGFGVTGIRWPVYWGFLITDFVFDGISHAGTLISAILRLVNAGWSSGHAPAEVITAFALMIGGLFPIIHLGKPWLFFWLVPYPNQRLIWPNFRSPLVWDFFAISAYLSGSLLFLFLPMILDFALIRIV
jgi:hypothetical protein